MLGELTPANPVPGFAGSRSGALIATAWASMVHLGNDGFLRVTDQIMRVRTRRPAWGRALRVNWGRPACASKAAAPASRGALAADALPAHAARRAAARQRLGGKHSARHT
jgi:hypothetical protein